MGAWVLTNGIWYYPIGSSVRVDAALERLSALGIEAAGRQGTFDYLPSAHVVAKAVEARLGGAPTAAEAGKSPKNDGHSATH